jgi:uncharacterized CHY-type Zn-finger protein
MSSSSVAGGLIAALFLLFAWQVADAQEPVAEPTSFEGYPGAPAINVVPRKTELFFYPCAQCHATMEPNPEIRKLNIHVAEIEHGRGRMWCLNCHDLEERNYLRTFLGESVDFDDAPVICGGCHANRHEDWAFGIHGKRVATWQGERTVYSCTHCHDPHKPAIAPRAPAAPPGARTGLELQPGEPHENVPVWDRREGHE